MDGFTHAPMTGRWVDDASHVTRLNQHVHQVTIPAGNSSLHVRAFQPCTLPVALYGRRLCYPTMAHTRCISMICLRPVYASIGVVTIDSVRFGVARIRYTAITVPSPHGPSYGCDVGIYTHTVVTGSVGHRPDHEAASSLPQAVKL
jgi:hypothetical protein